MQVGKRERDLITHLIYFGSHASKREIFRATLEECEYEMWGDPRSDTCTERDLLGDEYVIAFNESIYDNFLMVCPFGRLNFLKN